MTHIDVLDATPVGGSPVATRSHQRLRRVGWAVLVVVLAGALYFGVTLYQVHSTGRSDESQPVDAIVVMGAAQYDGRPSPLLQARLDHALALWDAGWAPLMVVTGGNQEGDRFTEAGTSAQYLIERGVPNEAILQENRGRSSYASLRAVATLLRERDLVRVLLVSDPFHSLRIKLTAEELGLQAMVSPVPDSPVDESRALRREIKEAAGVAVGRIIGFRRLLSITG